VNRVGDETVLKSVSPEESGDLNLIRNKGG